MTLKLIEKELGPELMLYEAEQDTVYVLNPTAQIIYQLYKKRKTPMEIEQEIRRSFRIKADENVIEDVNDCLEQLRKMKLI